MGGSSPSGDSQASVLTGDVTCGRDLTFCLGSSLSDNTGDFNFFNGLLLAGFGGDGDLNLVVGDFAGVLINTIIPYTDYLIAYFTASRSSFLQPKQVR